MTLFTMQFLMLLDNSRGQLAFAAVGDEQPRPERRRDERRSGPAEVRITRQGRAALAAELAALEELLRQHGTAHGT
jgi:hypothetical protein